MVAKLEKAKSLRDAFPSEVKDMSRWIQDNIDEISAITDLPLSKVDREQPAGDFSVDLLAEDGQGGMVVIENQIGKSDHDHLGKLLTYLTAYKASAAIWIVESPRVEHVNAMAWLNQTAAEDCQFYLVKVEAVRIASSDWAPLMTLIVGPSEDAITIEHEKGEVKLRHTERLRFWEGLLDTANRKTKLHAGRSPTKDGWISAGSGYAGLNFTYVTRQHDVQVEFWIGRGAGKTEENKQIFDQLYLMRERIEKSFGGNLEWQRLETKEGSRIRATSDIGGYRDPEKWQEIFEWMTDKMSALEKAIGGVLPLIMK
jgi:hypothetical protein